MPLQTTLMPVELGLGMDTKTDPKQVIPGKLLLLKNGILNKFKKVQKRNGYDALSTEIISGGDLESSQALTAYNNELLQTTENFLYSRSQSASKWIARSTHYCVALSNQSIIRNNYEQTIPDLAIVNGIACYAYENTSNGGVSLTVLDITTGVIIQNNVDLTTSPATAQTPRCVVLGHKIYIYYWKNTGSICLRILDTLDPSALGTEIVLKTDGNTTNRFYDVYPSDGVMVLAYYVETTNQIRVLYVDSNGNPNSILFPADVLINQTVSENLTVIVEYTNYRIVVLYTNGVSGFSYTALNSDFTVYQTHTVIDSATAFPALRVAPYVISSTQIGIFYEKSVTGTSTYNSYVSYRALTILGGGGSNSVLMRSVGLASKPFEVDDEFFVKVVHDSTLQATYFCLRSDGKMIAKIQPDQASGLPARHFLPQVTVIDSVAYFPCTVKTKIVTQNNTVYSTKGISVEKINFDHDDAFINRQIGNILILSGGYVAMYDGTSLVELNFHLFPENVTATPAGSGGNLSAGSYQYYVVAEWPDSKGNIHRSEPTPDLSPVTAVNNDQVTLTIPTLRITEKSNVLLCVYRTVVNGTVAYKVGSVANDKTVDSVNYVDGASDASITSNEIIYTSGGIIPNNSPTGARVIDISKNRAIVAGLEDAMTFGYSKQYVPGEAIAFSDFFRITVDPLGGDIANVRFMDDKIVIFKDRHIFYIAGDGPDDAGNNNTFTEPVLISSDVGNPYPKACVLTPMGLMFKSYKGFYMLDRSLNVSYIGADIEAYNSYTITDATLVSDKNQVRFLTTDEYALVYDYLVGQWYLFSNHDGNGAAIWLNNYAYVRSDGEVYVENNDKYLDDATTYALGILFGWLKLSLLQGYQRVRKAFFLGEYYSAHKLQVQVAYDYEPFFSQSYIFDAATVIGDSVYGETGIDYGEDSPYGGTDTGVLQFRLDLTRQKCEAVQFYIEDFYPTQSLQAYSLTDLLLEIGIKKGGMKLPLNKKVGSS